MCQEFQAFQPSISLIWWMFTLFTGKVVTAIKYLPPGHEPPWLTRQKAQLKCFMTNAVTTAATVAITRTTTRGGAAAATKMKQSNQWQSTIMHTAVIHFYYRGENVNVNRLSFLLVAVVFDFRVQHGTQSFQSNYINIIIDCRWCHRKKRIKPDWIWDVFQRIY